jgi:TolB protein
VSDLDARRNPAGDISARRDGPLSRRSLLTGTAAGWVALAGAQEATRACAAAKPDARRPRDLVGYTELCTNLPGGRRENVITMRACVVRGDGVGRYRIAEGLASKPGQWTQFASWSPDGRHAIVGVGWESAENAAWEEQHREFRMTEGWLYDTCLVDVRTGEVENVTAVERVSDYNTGVFYFPGTDAKLGFQALIKGVSHPYVMDRDGRNKRDISASGKGFTYGYSASPDGSLVSYHSDYQIYIAHADGSGARRIETGNPFNFSPQWSPDGEWLLFVSGEHYDCHPYVVKRDGGGLRKIAGRGGYRGVVPFLDVPDFHDGSSDVPVWSVDGRSVFFTARLDDRVEMMNVTLDGTVRRLTHSRASALSYHPHPHPGGQWILYGSNRTGTRQLYVMRTDGSDDHAITTVPPGHAAMWPSWRPASHSGRQALRSIDRL